MDSFLLHTSLPLLNICSAQLSCYSRTTIYQEHHSSEHQNAFALIFYAGLSVLACVFAAKTLPGSQCTHTNHAPIESPQACALAATGQDTLDSSLNAPQLGPLKWILGSDLC